MKHWLHWLALCCWLWLPSATQAVAAGTDPDSCTPQVLSVQAAPVTNGGDGSIRPTTGWEPVTLPDIWAKRWPGHDGTVWYRLDWQRADCPANTELGLRLDGISMAGAVYSNDALLWRDQSLTEPLSMSWNMPRWWPLPEWSLHTDTQSLNTIWVQVQGMAAFTPGLGRMQVGPVAQVRQAYAQSLWNQRSTHYITMGISAAMGCIFLVVWCLMRSEHAFGWYAMMALCWVLYLSTMLATESWLPGGVLMHSRINNLAFVLYVLGFCLFTWRFGGQRLPRVERALWLLVAVGAALSLLASRQAAEWVWVVFALVFMANCLQFQWHAWRTRDPQHLLLALCWLVFLLVAAHDLWMVLHGWPVDAGWNAITGPIAAIFMALLLGGRLASSLRRIAHFNQELQEHVTQAQRDLADVLAREHAQALSHATLQQRMQIVHDLHDGLGGSLVRSMALVEQARAPLSNERMLSLLKVLRDDLRQVIDQGANDDATVPSTPVQWIAPLRHRFTRLFDELDVQVRWQIPPNWQQPPSPLQCLGLARLIEEALSNVIKHSWARWVGVSCQQPQPDVLEVMVMDDGVGFDLQAVQDANLSVGMRSMAARAERMGGTFSVSSDAHGTVVRVVVPLAPAAEQAEYRDQH